MGCGGEASRGASRGREATTRGDGVLPLLLVSVLKKKREPASGVERHGLPLEKKGRNSRCTAAVIAAFFGLTTTYSPIWKQDAPPL